MAGNQFNTEIETSRADASVGLLLKANEEKEYLPISPVESGFFVPYNVKDIEMISLGKDKKKGVLVSSNDGLLRLFRIN